MNSLWILNLVVINVILPSIWMATQLVNSYIHVRFKEINLKLLVTPLVHLTSITPGSTSIELSIIQDKSISCYGSTVPLNYYVNVFDEKVSTLQRMT